MREDVEKLFDIWITHTFWQKKDAQDFLKRHERKAICVDRLCGEIKKIEKAIFSITWDSKRYKWVIEQTAALFCQNALRHAEESALTSGERQRRLDEVDRLPNLEKKWDAHAQEVMNEKATSYLNSATAGKPNN